MSQEPLPCVLDFILCLVLVKPRKTCPDITEKIVDWDVKNLSKQTMWSRHGMGELKLLVNFIYV